MNYIKWDSKLVQPTTWESVWQYLLKLNRYMSYNPAISLLGVYQKACTKMIMAHSL